MAPSYHRYDTVDFRALDPLLGSWADLNTLVEQAHARGVRLIADIALNHVSDQHPWFLQALKNEQARERQYFTFSESGIYKCWWGHRSLPELRLSHPDLQHELTGRRQCSGFLARKRIRWYQTRLRQ
jgi:glycosidase